MTRVARINGAVPPDKKEAFTGRALGLLNCSTSDDFQLQAKLIIRDFLKLTSWMEWWMRPSHASILFESEKKMDVEIWERLPSTTNAEEAMHAKFYKACGRDHAFLEGMNALYAFALHFERLFQAVTRLSATIWFQSDSNNCFLDGAPIRYGISEPWKVKAAEIGHTKPSCAPKPAEKKMTVVHLTLS